MGLIDPLDTPHIVVSGNPVDGLRFTGPFDTYAEARAEAQGNAEAYAEDGDWWVARLRPSQDPADQCVVGPTCACQNQPERMNQPEPLLSLDEVHGGFKFTGDLDVAKALIEEDQDAVVESTFGGDAIVHLRDRTDPASSTISGYGQSLDEAWRFALGAYWSTAHEDDLRHALAQAKRENEG